MTPVTLATIAPLRRWVGWRNQMRNGKPTKVPFAPLTGELAKADDPSGWTSRPEAETWARVHINGSGGGVGLQLGPVEGEDYAFGGIDLDTCRDPATGTIEPWALEVITRIGSYAEISPSGTGVKAFFLYATADTSALRPVMGTNFGKQFKRGKRDHPPAIELHIGNRYFAVTDQHLADTPAELCLVALRTLVWLLSKAGPAFVRDGVGQAELKEPLRAGTSANTTTDSDPSGSAADNDALHARLYTVMRSKQRLKERWNGSTAGLQDASRSGMDMSVTTMLKNAGFSYPETRALLLQWSHGAGTEHACDERYFQRMWDRCSAPEAAADGCLSTGMPPQTRKRQSKSYRTDDEPEPWAEPVDFLADGDITGVPELREEHLPLAIYPFVTDTAARMGVDPASVALPSVVSVASAVNDEWQLQPRQHDDEWTEAARLWGAIVGGSSILKTLVIRACTRPLELLDAEARRRHASEMRQYEEDMTAWKKADSEASPKPSVPLLDRYIVEGTTTEALSEVLRSDGDAKQRAPVGKVLVRQDEMAEWISGFDRYRSGGRGGSDRGAYLRTYNGGRFTIDRIGRGSFAIPNWSACILGGIQPEPIQRIAREAADDGLLQRFMFCVADRQGDGEDRVPDRDARRRYEALFPVLVTLHPPVNSFAGPTDARNEIQNVVLHADAHRHRQSIDALARAMAAMPDTSNRLKSAFGKWSGLFARLALTFHLVEIADARANKAMLPVLTVLSEGTARRAANYMRDILLPHLLRAEALMFSTAQSGHARWIAGLILASGKLRFTLREVVQAYGALRAPDCRRDLLEVMESLVTVGWLRPEEQSNPARQPAAWAVNPAVLTLFAERAELERKARTKARKVLAEAVAKGMSLRRTS
jgi:hypothetical protein